MTRRPDHSRNGTRWGTTGHHTTGSQAGGGRPTSSRNRSDDLAASTAQNGPVHEAPGPFELPLLDVETIARNNALWVHLRGEADIGNHLLLHTGLTQVRLHGAEAVHLVLTELTFCDVYAFRHLVAFARRVRAGNQELSAHGACPTIKKIARLLDVAHDFHFV